jgi:CRP-like cAMP-binding protein
MIKRRESSRPPPADPSKRNPNRLLAALPADDYARIQQALESVTTRLKQILHKPGEPVGYVYFPGAGFCSVLTVLEDGRMVEVATIGREGAVGVSAILDGAPSPSASMVQAEMEVCYRMTADAFRREMDRRGVFYVLLTHFAQALVGFVMQSTACNAVHSIEQRLARWLLMARDRVESNGFPLTQEFAAMMLGASRPTVSVVAGTLQRAGLIKYHRGHVTILDGAALEEASCECYRTATDLLNRVTSSRSTRGRFR